MESTWERVERYVGYRYMKYAGATKWLVHRVEYSMDSTDSRLEQNNMNNRLTSLK